MTTTWQRDIQRFRSENDPSERLDEYDAEVIATPRRLRELAGWYREFAERAGNPTIWEARLRTAQDLDAKADRLERQLLD
jgi:hypothetical protein